MTRAADPGGIQSGANKPYSLACCTEPCAIRVGKVSSDYTIRHIARSKKLKLKKKKKCTETREIFYIEQAEMRLEHSVFIVLSGQRRPSRSFLLQIIHPALPVLAEMCY